jgi:hypothetical protein
MRAIAWNIRTAGKVAKETIHADQYGPPNHLELHEFFIFSLGLFQLWFVIIGFV